ncbi:hypothetical protein BDN67DRAFT_1004284 [Paxillus ammoniavirescens]|nr:hypothetical protein BDN67DRAFT_1004284 [Paxillus ammoniavirescens]
MQDGATHDQVNAMHIEDCEKRLQTLERTVTASERGICRSEVACSGNSVVSLSSAKEDFVRVESFMSFKVPDEANDKKAGVNGDTSEQPPKRGVASWRVEESDVKQVDHKNTRYSAPHPSSVTARSDWRLEIFAAKPQHQSSELDFEGVVGLYVLKDSVGHEIG